jgi:protein gp37
MDVSGAFPLPETCKWFTRPMLVAPAEPWFEDCGPSQEPVEMSAPEMLAGRMLWVVGECERGGERRPALADWFRVVRNEMRSRGLPFFLKQMEVGGLVVKMPELDERVWDETPFQ